MIIFFNSTLWMKIIIACKKKRKINNVKDEIECNESQIRKYIINKNEISSSKKDPLFSNCPSHKQIGIYEHSINCIIAVN